MRVITFLDYTPLPRFDGKKWARVRIEEGPAATGPWMQIDDQAISPLDIDPRYPASRNFTTENASEALNPGWYRLTFIDQDNDEQLPTEPIPNTPEITLPYIPPLSRVASIERARTRSSSGQELGTFTNETRPTAAEAEAMLTLAAAIVTAQTGTSIPVLLYPAVADLIAIYAAMLIEISYFPEQVATNRSTYEQLKALFDQAMPQIMTAIEREISIEEGIPDDPGGAGMPYFGFGNGIADQLIGLRTIW